VVSKWLFNQLPALTQLRSTSALWQFGLGRKTARREFDQKATKETKGEKPSAFFVEVFAVWH